MKRFLVYLSLCSVIAHCEGLKSNRNSCCLATETSNYVSDHLTNLAKSVSFSVNKSANVTISNVNLNLRNNGQPVISLDIKNSDFEQEVLQTISNKILAISKPFNPAQSSLTSSQCRIHSKLFLNSLQKLDLWALKMYDSTAKISSGILNGNVNYFGDFDQCIGIQGPGDDFTGQYCLTHLQTSITNNFPRLKYLHKLVQSHGAFISEFDDPGHRVPRFSMINWAVCTPSSCTPREIEYSLKEYVQNFTSGTGIQVQVRVDPQMCHIKNIEPYDKYTIWTCCLFLAIIGISLISTFIEYKFENPNPWFVAFSLQKNVLSILNMERDPNDIGSLHGIRFLNAVLLLLAHKSMALFFDPYINRTQMAESLGQSWTVIGRAAAIYTDVFLLFSGLLTSYSLIGKLQKNRPLKLIQEYVGRFMRIVPTFGALILFCTFILPHLGTGPQWNLVVAQHATKCKKYWWRNLLFIHNYFGFEEMCLTHTHHLGIDTELFVVAPPMILILWKWPKRGGIFLMSLAALSTYARFYVTVVHKLSNYVYFGTSIQKLFRTADYMYAIPFHRATIYILGIFLGYALRTYKNYKLTETQLKIGWYVSWTLFIAVFFGPAPMGSINYVYNEYHAAVYAAFGPMAWCALAAWVVFTSHLGYESLLSRALSWKGFLITTRVSYAIYLTQFPVFFYNVGRRRHASFYEFFSQSVNIHEYIWIGIASVALTLFFDCPFQNIKKIIFKSTSPPSQNVAVVNNCSVSECDKKQL